MFASHAQTWQASSTWSTEDRDRLGVPNLPGPGDKDRLPSPSRLRGRLQSLRRASSPGARSNTPSPENSKGALGLTLLHDPSEPRVDFVFVHGLNGGSKRSWSASSDPTTFWPKEWLPSEAGFKHVRIHSFGYDSDWSKSQQSSLTIHDFGQALLADLYNAPHLKKNGNTPIVLVAHSMGGLVVKKAYLLARRDPIYADIAGRIHSLYFLGTPHRGADSSSFVSTFIAMSLGSGSKAFVKELIPGSGTLQVSLKSASILGMLMLTTQAINDEFRHVCSDVGLWSFFEGIPTAAGPTNVVVVEKESAVMGLPGEHTQYLQADHRRLVKFDSTEDPNYNILLRCFNTTIEEIEKEYISDKFDNHRAQIKQIASTFDIAERPDGDFMRVYDRLHQGSCEWLTSHPSFLEWLELDLMDANPTVKAITAGPTKVTPRFLWLNGPPGSGKSVASTHVIKYLESFNLDCAYFFFKNNEKPSLTQLLLSLALQMAESNFQVRHTFLSMIEEGEVVDCHSDHVMVWNNIFLGRIFKMAFSQPQYWVIDALDECQSRLLTTLVAMLARIEPTVPLRILITSRPNGHVERLLNQERVLRSEIHTGQAASLRDIEAFVRARLSPTIIEDFHEQDQDESDLVADIIEKSNGIFLWASLIMTRLDDAHSIEAMRNTLNQVPKEMSGMYNDILKNIIESPNAELAQCILTWVVCARKPLTTDELREAVRLDINQTLRTSDRFAQICGNMITVDNNYVQVMHQTVKEFLTGEQSDYYIPRAGSHARIAELCLTHLNGRNFNPPRTRRVPSFKNNSAGANDTAFDEYACANFSYHLSHCSPSEETLELLPLLGSFFSSNILTWIERIAKTGRLALIMRTIQNLKAYLKKQVATCSPIDSDYQLVSRFVEDLLRLSAIYGPNLVNTPSCIYSLVPLLCPTSSIIHWKFARTQFRQKVICNFNTDWDERLSSLSFATRVMSIACGDQFFAVGLGDGVVKVYRQSTFELLNTFRHGEPVRKLANGHLTGILVTAGLKTVKVWGPRQTLLWSVNVPEQPLSIEFSPDDSKIYVPLRSGEVYVYRSKGGARLDCLALTDEDGSSSSSSDSESDGEGGERYKPNNQKKTNPMLVKICPSLGIAAVAYRSSHLQVSYYDNEDGMEAFEKEGYEDGQGLPSQVLDVAFNPNVEQSLMAVAYQDGDLVTFDPWTLQQKNTHHLNAHTLAASPDGQTLAAGDSECVITLFAFYGLRQLCRIESMDERIMGIVFASNSLRLFDLRGNTCNVWEPSVLIKKNLTDDGSSDVTDDYFTSTSSNLVCTRTFEGSNEITVMAQAGDSDFVFCGREEGAITLHDITTGKVCAEFQFHARMVEIRHLEWHAQSKVLFSVDASRRCIATRITLPRLSSSSKSTSPVEKLKQELGQQSPQFEHILDFRASDHVLQALISPDGTSFLVSTQSGEEMHTISTVEGEPKQEPTVIQTTNSMGPARWLAHPTDSDRLLLFDHDMLHVFLWKTLERQSPPNGIIIHPPPELSHSHDFILSDDWLSRPGLSTIYQTIDMPTTSSKLSSVPETGFLTLDLSKISPVSPAPSVEVSLVTRKLLSPIKSILGLHKSTLYFISGRGWVCSISLKNLPSSKSYTRHFFIPSVWQTADGQGPMAKVVSKGSSVAMVYRDEVVVLSGFLEFEHKTVFGVCDDITELGGSDEEGEAAGRDGVPVITRTMS
ncbi:hypothetical protein QC762_309600 [Podospora pseudocomata]|uniref:GPI inositol-deacylase n=1 Tax=Podospora pseudocomata TaxID=2093779 RepID=A0ABR0GKR2_9PEZI|nr:hypothetical protein QC762_309600 [Podospora pseudocomata]